MKRVTIVLVLVCLGFGAIAQSQEVAEGDSIAWEFRKQAFIYSSAKAFGDPDVAKMALYNLISENPSNPALYDSLALIYLQYNKYASAALSAQQSLLINANNRFATEIAASAFESLGVKDKALPYYETLYLDNNDLNMLYKIAFLQMELERFAEAITSTDIIMSKAESESILIRFPTQDGAGQDVPLKVAAHRVKAMVEESRGNVDEAKRLYLATLEMFPGFQVVQQQLQNVGK